METVSLQKWLQVQTLGKWRQEKVNHVQKHLLLIQRTWLNPKAALLLILQDRIKEHLVMLP